MTMTSGSTRYLTCAETAKLVRAELKAQFPGVKFSIRSSNYAGGASINVRWNNGPTHASVRAITDRYRCSDFDGMTDLMTSRPSTLLAGPDGTVEQVHYGADFISCARELAGDYRARLQVEAAEALGLDSTEDLNDCLWIESVHTEHGWFDGGNVWTLLNWLADRIPA